MSGSLQGVVVHRQKTLELLPGNDLVAVVVARLSKMLETFYQHELDREDYVDAFNVALDYVRQRGPHPGRTPEGAFLTCSLLQVLGSEVHSNVFNPIRWSGIQAMNDELVAAGSPVPLISPERSGGPWGMSDSDYFFIGGWDQPTLRALANAIKNAESEGTSFVLNEFKRWIQIALDNELTIWAWHS